MKCPPARVAVLWAALLGFAAISPAPAHAERFSFMALGDMPYVLPGGYAAFARLIERTNALKPAFTIHVGDIISGQTRCDDERYERVREAGVIRSRAVLVAIGIDWEGRRQALNLRIGRDPPVPVSRARRANDLRCQDLLRRRRCISNPTFHLHGLLNR